MGRSKRARKPEGWQNVAVRRSGVHGWGLFARTDLAKGERVVEYIGEKVTKAESERRTNAQWARGRVYTFELNQRYDLDGSPVWNKARYANHSCDPTCETEIIRGRIWLVAIEDLVKGDEITYDYNFPVDDDLAPCNCGAANCRGYIVGSEHRAKLRRKLRRDALKGRR
jgi:SET domain-containing protein